MAKGLDRKSNKGVGSIKSKARIDKTTHLGKLMQKFRDVDEVLYPYVVNVGLVYEEMDFTIEEFADMTGAEVEDLIDDINRIIK